MKKLFLILMALAMIMPIMACDNDKILKTANVVYLDIKTVVTDPEVRPAISESNWEKLVTLERTYLEATMVLKEIPKDEGALEVLTHCADEILAMIGGMEYTQKYVHTIAAIRISVKVLKNHLKTV